MKKDTILNDENLSIGTTGKIIILYIVVSIVLILYGIFSRCFAWDTIYHIHKSETEQTLPYEVITASGNKIEYYNMD